jgi:hypothetical protein
MSERGARRRVGALELVAATETARGGMATGYWRHRHDEYDKR